MVMLVLRAPAVGAFPLLVLDGGVAGHRRIRQVHQPQAVRRVAEVPSWSAWPAPETIWTRLFARPSASATRLAVTLAPGLLIAATIELSVVVLSMVIVWPLM